MRGEEGERKERGEEISGLGTLMLHLASPWACRSRTCGACGGSRLPTPASASAALRLCAVLGGLCSDLARECRVLSGLLARARLPTTVWWADGLMAPNCLLARLVACALLPNKRVSHCSAKTDGQPCDLRRLHSCPEDRNARQHRQCLVDCADVGGAREACETCVGKGRVTVPWHVYVWSNGRTRAHQAQSSARRRVRRQDGRVEARAAARAVHVPLPAMVTVVAVARL